MALLAQLDELIRQDRDESPEGESLRSQMDELWFKSPEDKRREINKDVRLPNINIHD
jgi:hypothetical protein